jgi:hypothetical protein
MSVYLLAVASHCSDDGSCPGRGTSTLSRYFTLIHMGQPRLSQGEHPVESYLQRFGCLSEVPDTANCHGKVNLFGADRLCPAALLHFTLS